MQNKVGGYDANIGSTINGKYGYGYATDSAKDSIGTVSTAPGSSSSSGSYKKSQAEAGQNEQKTLEEQKNMNMETEHHTVTSNIAFIALP